MKLFNEQICVFGIFWKKWCRVSGEAKNNIGLSRCALEIMIGGFNFRTDVSDIMSDNIPDVKESTLLYPQRLTNGYKLTTQKISWFSRSLSKILDNKQALPMKCYQFTSWKEMCLSKRKKLLVFWLYFDLKISRWFFSKWSCELLELVIKSIKSLCQYFCSKQGSIWY